MRTWTEINYGSKIVGRFDKWNFSFPIVPGTLKLKIYLNYFWKGMKTKKENVRNILLPLS